MSKYRKSWTQALQEVFNESAGLHLKMAFDDAGIKIKGVKGGKLVIAKKDKKKAEKALKKSFRKGGIPEIQYEEVELDEVVNLKKLKKEYDKNEDKNYHTENYLLLAKAFGTSKEVKTVEEILAKNKMRGHTTKSDMDWMYKNINPYYDKIRNEEVELDEGTAYPPTIENLRMIVKDKQHQKFMFPKGQALVDLFTASAMVQVYDALKPATKKKFEDMIKSKEGFMKSQAFAMKMAK